MTSRDVASQFDQIEPYIRERMAYWHIPGVAIGILHDGKSATRGYGVASLETAFPVRPDTLFQIGSISKVFTATLVMRLVEAGELDLDTPVITYLQELKLADETARDTITLRHV